MAEPDPLMSIGMFSRASLVSIKALRSYHEMGILVPAEVDPNTGYRSYRASQLIDAGVIYRLRALDVSLPDIAQVLQARDPELTRKVVAEHRATMESRLSEIEQIVEQLQEAEHLPTLHTPVHVRLEPEVHALKIAGMVQDADYGPFLDRAFGTLWQALQQTAAIPTGSGSALYPAHVESDDEPVEAYIPIAEPVTVPPDVIDRGVVLAMIPSATCAVLTHAGTYRTIAETYRRLGSWVAGNAVHVEKPIREHYVVSVDQTTGQLVPDDQLRTDIAWPIDDQQLPSDQTHKEQP